MFRLRSANNTGARNKGLSANYKMFSIPCFIGPELDFDFIHWFKLFNFSFVLMQL